MSSLYLRRFLTTLTILLCLLFYTPSLRGDDGKPIAIGVGEKSRYVLYSDGYLYQLLESGELRQISKLNLDEELYKSYILDFEVYENVLYLYAYRSVNASSGLTLLKIYDLNNGGILFSREYRFNVKEGKTVYGQLVSTIIACSRGFAVLTVNSTKNIIVVFSKKDQSFTAVWIYDGRLAATVYNYNDTLIAPVLGFGEAEGRLYPLPTVVDLIENRILFSLPALIPVTALAYPLIQVSRVEANWTCYVSVLNPSTNKMEFYKVYPNNYTLFESNAAQSSPHLTYLIIDKPTGSGIVFPDGASIETRYRLSMIPCGVFIPINPSEGVLDVNVDDHSALIKIVSGDEAKIIYLENGSYREVYSLPVEHSSKLDGFYAALVGKTVYIIDPRKEELVTINPNNLINMAIYIAIPVSAVTVAAILTVMYRKRPTHKPMKHKE